MTPEHVFHEGRVPHIVPVIVGVYTDKVQRTAPGMRVLFRKGQLAASDTNSFVFDHVGLVEAHHPDATIDSETAAIEAGVNEVRPLPGVQNDDVPDEAAGAKFSRDRGAVAAVSKWLSAHGWTVITSETGFVAKVFPELTEAWLDEVGDFLHAPDEHDDAQRVWAAMKGAGRH